jgi:S-adenosylmethionine decarboxylase
VAFCAETTAPSHERRLTGARREFLAHRSGSAHERKQKVDFGATWWSRREPPERAKRRFFSCNGKKMAPQCRKIRQVEKSPEKSGQNLGRRERVQALGRHLLLELFDCDAEAINSLDTVKATMVEAAKRAQATIVDVVFHEFNPFGISGVVVIAESHLAIHTWPEYRYAAVDVFSCGDVLQPQVAADYLVEQLGAARASVVELQRGIFVNHPRKLLHKPAGAPVASTPS